MIQSKNLLNFSPLQRLYLHYAFLSVVKASGIKKICFIFSLISITLAVSGQTRKGKIYLKNGSIIKGKITESESSDTLRVKSAGNLWVFPANEIEKTGYPAKRSKGKESEGVSGFLNHTQLGVQPGNNQNSENAPFFFHSELNYRYSNKILFGIGSGVEFFKDTHLPVFGNIEYRFRNAWFTPYLFCKAGYTFPLENTQPAYYNIVPYYSMSSAWPAPLYNGSNLKAKGGVLLNPGFGIVNMFSYNFGMSFSVGYRFTRLHYKGENNYRLDIDYNRLSVMLGIIFK